MAYTLQNFDRDEERKRQQEEARSRLMQRALQADPNLAALYPAPPAGPQAAPPPAAPPARNQEVHMHLPEQRQGDTRSPAEKSADKVNEAWKEEMDSRVAQSREMRRMQHEKDMEAMRQEGLLRRLSMTQQRQEPSDGGPVSGIINRSPNTRTGEWEYYGPFGYGG